MWLCKAYPLTSSSSLDAGRLLGPSSVKALLKIDSFEKITDKVSKISKSISKSNSKWAKPFYDIVDETYQRNSAMCLLTLAATCWNSAQAMFASQLRMSTACKVFSVCWAGDGGWPKEYDSWQDYSFWKDAAEAELMIRPLIIIITQ